MADRPGPETAAFRRRRVLDRFAFGGPGPGLPADAGDVMRSLLYSPWVVAAPPDLGDEPDLLAGGPALVQAGYERLAQQQAALVMWWLDQMVTTPTPFVEAMTWFWHGHFATASTPVQSARLMLRQNQTLRGLGQGGFEPLVQAMAVDPAMLIWLNGYENRVGAPNENLARELMELFVLGIGHYSETDVKESARALTGWVVDRPSIVAALLPVLHDITPKQVLGVAVQGTSDLVTMLVARPEAPQFLAGRVWSRFATGAPPPPDVLARLVAALGPTRDVRALMAAVVAEPLFFDAASSVVRAPVPWLVGLMRSTGVRPAYLPLPEQERLRYLLDRMGQLPFEPPSVGGWPSGRAWLTTGSAYYRFFLAQLVAGHADVSTVAAAGPAARPEALARMLGVDGWTARTVDSFGRVVDDPRALLTLAACAPEYVVSR